MRSSTTSLLFGLVALCLCATARSDSQSKYGFTPSGAYGKKNQSFQRIATVPNYVNNDDIADATVSEIIAVTKNGRMLVYTDASTGSIGFIDISHPSHAMSFGTVALDGEPTSVEVLGNELALVAVDNSDSFVAPGGQLVVVDIATRSIVASHELGGQPDSMKVSDDGKFLAIVIENQRDEDVVVDGEEGGLPQLPAGFLVIADIAGEPASWGLRTVDLSGYSSYAPEDPEPEFVDINADNEAVVSLQENNHVLIVDLPSGLVTGGFDAGTVDLVNVDNNEDGLISLTDNISGVPREPDAIAWVPLGNGDYRIATANEGDLFGGSRGFTIFDRQGNVVYDSGNEFEKLAVENGHYPEDRSENKGSEPESIEFGRFGKDDYLFVGSERGSFVAVYELDRKGEPQFKQILPAPLGPEGVLA
ncbi:MAG: esterase-like activity of phytase family protein, partial [Woeseiaceae bacterium]